MKKLLKIIKINYLFIYFFFIISKKSRKVNNKKKTNASNTYGIYSLPYFPPPKFNNSYTKIDMPTNIIMRLKILSKGFMTFPESDLANPDQCLDVLSGTSYCSPLIFVLPLLLLYLSNFISF